MIEIKPLTLSSLSPVEEMERSLFPDPWGKGSLEEHLEAPHAHSFFALFDGTVAGYVLGSVIAGEGEILRIGVKKEYRNRGVASSLLSHLIREGMDRGCKTLFLEVRAGNKPAIGLYEKWGFTLCGVRKNYYSAPTEDARIYQLELKG